MSSWLVKTGLIATVLSGVWACSSEEDTGAAGGAGAPSTGGSSSTGAAPATGGSSSTGAAPATGGSSSTGAAPATGGSTGAAGGTGGAASTGGATGTGGTGSPLPPMACTALAACPATANKGTTADLAIDDLEDKNNAIACIGGRLGFWYTFAGAGGTIMPAPMTVMANPTTGDCHGGMYCMKVSGMLPPEDPVTSTYPFAGVGFDFSNAMTSCAYDVSGYTGIKFWAKGTVSGLVRVKVGTKQTTMMGAASPAGTCAMNCSDAFGKDITLTTTWTEVELPFATLMQAGWGTVATWVPTEVLDLQIQFPAGVTFDAAFDDFTFY